MRIRTVSPDEDLLCAELGGFVVAAYVTLPGHVEEPDYERDLADVAARASMDATAVLAAFDGDRPLGCVTYVSSPASPMAEGQVEGEAGFRMLAVDPAVQRGGAGRALVEACIEQAAGEGRHSLCMHTTPWMTAAHRLYESLGFVRDPDRDWVPAPDVDLLGYRLPLIPR